MERTRLQKLNDTPDLRVTPGDPDPRGWEVDAADGSPVGRVTDLIVDTTDMKARYLDVEVNPGLSRQGDLHVLVPTESVEIGARERESQRVSLPVPSQTVVAAARPGATPLGTAAPETARWPRAGGDVCNVRFDRGGNRG